MLFKKERRDKIVLMIYELIEYINSFENVLERKINIDSTLMTMISCFAESNNETPIETTNRLLDQFKSIEED